MTTLHATDSLTLRKHLEVARGGDTIKCHAPGPYTDPLDSYTTQLSGGNSWGTALTIEAYQRKGQSRDRVVLAPAGGDFVLRPAFAINRYLRFRGIQFDGRLVARSSIKVTYSGPKGTELETSARYIRFEDCQIYDSPLSCVLSDSRAVPEDPWPIVEFLRCNIYGAGRPGTDGTSAAVYAPGGGVLVSRSRLHDCTGIGACFYSAAPEKDGSPIPLGSRIEWSQVYGCGRSGITLAGQGDEAEGNTCLDNSVGIHVWPTSRGAQLLGNLTKYNRDHQVYIDPASVGCFERMAA